MASKPQLTIAEFTTIRLHNDSLIDGAQLAIQNIRSIPARDRTYVTKNQLLYWLDVVKALRWSTQIAAQKARIADNVAGQV